MGLATSDDFNLLLQFVLQSLLSDVEWRCRHQIASALMLDGLDIRLVYLLPLTGIVEVPVNVCDALLSLNVRVEATMVENAADSGEHALDSWVIRKHFDAFDAFPNDYLIFTRIVRLPLQDEGMLVTRAHSYVRVQTKTDK